MRHLRVVPPRGDREELTLICAGGDNDGEIIGLAQGSVEDNVLVHILWCVIADKAHESDLVVDDE